jgi:hypothetical protein
MFDPWIDHRDANGQKGLGIPGCDAETVLHGDGSDLAVGE